MSLRTLLLAALAALLTALPGVALAEACTQERFEDASYVVCTVDPSSADLRLFWKNAENQPLRAFSSLADMVQADGHRLGFAVNAGMYNTDFAPLGLYVEGGEQKVRANTREAAAGAKTIPNFYKKPNGVFFLADGTAGIATTEAYLAEDRQVAFATQSGPMLVIDGELHPALIEGSTDRTRRSGVGVCENGMVRVAVSEGFVNFHQFARLFRDDLHCANALFLDGGRGVGIYSPELGRNDFSWHGGYGPMLGLIE